MFRLFVYMYFLLCAAHCLGQEKSTHICEVRKMFNTIKSTSLVTYKYDLAVKFPDGTKENLSGEVMMDNHNRSMYSANEAQTIFYTDDWYYRADHNEKTVTVIRLDKHLSKEAKRQLQKELFENVNVSVFLDSVILKKAIVSKYELRNDTTSVVLKFPAELMIKEMLLSYLEENTRLISYSISTFMPWQGNEFGKNKGTSQYINCHDFKNTTETGNYETSKYFVINNNKVVLKKYSNYTLNVKI